MADDKALEEKFENLRALAKQLNSPGSINLLQETSRAEVISGLALLLQEALQKALKTANQGPKVQQKWFTTAAYLAQVMGKLARDLEYEKLHIEFEELRTLVEQRNVPVAHPVVSEKAGNPQTENSGTGRSQGTPG